MVKCPRCFDDALYSDKDDLVFCLKCGFVPVTTRLERINQPTAGVVVEWGERRVMEHLKKADVPLSVADIAIETGMSRNTVKQAVNRLYRRGLVECEGKGAPRSPRIWKPSALATSIVPGKTWTLADAAEWLDVSIWWVEKMAQRYRIGQLVGSRRVLFERDLKFLRRMKEEREHFFTLGREMTRRRRSLGTGAPEGGLTDEEFRALWQEMLAEREAKKRARKEAAV
jgi:DNA-binding transcriptional ArsR family regulator